MESQFLRDLVKHDFAGVTPQILEGEGGIQRAVSATTIAHDIDLMVVGTRGRTGLGKALLGSTAEELLRHATCPVLTVGPSVRSENGASRKVKRIVYASDFGVASVAAAPVALALAEHYGAHLTVLHVAKQLRGADDFDSATYEDSYDRQLRSLIPKETSQRLQPDYVVAEGAPAEKILEVAKRVNADLIVLGARRSKGFPGAATHLSSSVVHQVVAEAGCPVLTYPEPKLA
jgi:nucleotide-binding universal stress UspA family protein